MTSTNFTTINYRKWLIIYSFSIRIYGTYQDQITNKVILRMDLELSIGLILSISNKSEDNDILRWAKFMTL